MGKLLRVLVLLVAGWLSLFPSVSFAAFPPVTTSGYVVSGVTYSTQTAAMQASCNATMAQYGYTGSCSPNAGTDSCHAVVATGGPWAGYEYDMGCAVQASTASACPANSTGTTSCTCNSGFSESGSTCVATPTCEVGLVKVFNITDGWKRTPSDGFDGYVSGNGHPPVSMCDGSCGWSYSGAEMAWMSSTPTASGLYRSSTDSRYVSTGAPCIGKSEAVDPQTVPPSCPGSVGEINGKTVCVGTAANPLPSVSATGRGGTPQASGNPAAGAVPAGVSGAGRVPSTGTGGASGGPSGSGGGVVVNPGRSTAPGDGTEQAACGAPGQPVCAVKMDETGTPNGDGTFTSLTNATNTAANQRDGAMASVLDSSGKDTSWGVIPTWLTNGSCSPTVLMTLPAKMGGTAVTLDICPHLPLIYTLMNFLWTVWTFFAVVAMVFRVTTSSGGG